MNVSLTPQLEAIVRKKVESGMYGNASEVIREAIRIMDQQDQLTRLRTAIAVADEQIERGEYYELTPTLWDEIFAEADRMEREGIEPDPDVCP
jgi:antitoxin ParD1/3/4